MSARGEDDVNHGDGSVLGEGVSGDAEDEPMEVVLLQEVQELRWQNKRIRVAGIVKCVNLIEREMTIFYECRDLRGIEEGSKVEVIGYLVSQVGDNNDPILVAVVVKNIEGTDLYLHQLSVTLRRKVLSSVNIIC
ncbi:hypothetical protein OJ253_1892 [Cryptosporidium canis]|uniref:Uncharacterized protein n=1 Tax=Cryptosporidium canis TaxID=195482 RepID=A0A9D5DG77_9CRYT|nr:hypothetical protein OJ253_1892 [Cryptosporidium canis]